MRKVRHIVSFGRGWNSWAMITLLIYILKIKVDEVVIALTGQERPETEEHAKRFEQAVFNRLNIKLTYVKSDLGDIYNYHFERKIIPFVSRRECTDKFKITPIKNYISKKYPNDITFMYIGYDYDEPERVYKSYHRKIKSGPNKGKVVTKSYNTPYICEFPLFQHKITRARCGELIKMLGVTPPVKSRCWFCPYQKEQGFISLYWQQPSLFQKSMELEENSLQFPKTNLLNKKGKSLREVKRNIESQQNLIRFGVNVPHLLLEYKA